MAPMQATGSASSRRPMSGADCSQLLYLLSQIILVFFASFVHSGDHNCCVYFDCSSYQCLQDMANGTINYDQPPYLCTAPIKVC